MTVALVMLHPAVLPWAVFGCAARHCSAATHAIPWPSGITLAGCGLLLCYAAVLGYACTVWHFCVLLCLLCLCGLRALEAQ